MKTKLLLIAFLAVFSLSAQTTHNLDWFAGVGSNVDLTIEAGDTVIWTWTSPSHTVENDPNGTSVETFNSGFLGPNGSTFQHTFTVEGSNDYYCSVHGAGSMSGTITVDPTASIEEEVFNTFSILPNPATTTLTLKLPNSSNTAEIEVFNIIGKRILIKSLNNTVDTALNIADLQSGMYIIRVTSGENTQTKRFIKL